MKALAAVLALLVLAACRTAAPPATLPKVDVLERADVAAALAAVDADREAILAQWCAVTEIPAPSGHEARRADFVEALLNEYALTGLHRDSAGNVIGTRKGTGGGKNIVLDAHLDTVF